MRTSFLLLPLLGLALASGWLLWHVQSSLEATRVGGDQGPAVTIEGLTATRLDQAGKPEFRVRAPYAEQLPENGGIQVAQPLLETLSDANDGQWKARSGAGWMAPDNSLVQLTEGVVLTRSASAAGPPMTVHTDELALRPAENLLETEHPVLMKTPAGELSGVGLRAYLDEQRIELLAEVRSRYLAP